MHYYLFRWIPKSAISRLMGVLASVPWPGWVLRPVVRLYVAVYRIDMEQFETPPGGFATFNAFFTRPLRPGARPVDPDPRCLVSPVDGAVSAAGRIEQGRLIQAKGRSYELADLLAGGADAEAYEGGSFLTLYLSPRDYHRIHAPGAARVTGYSYVPGQLWTVSPSGTKSVPRLFARNERLLSVLAADWGDMLLIAVGALVVGKIRVVYHSVTSNRIGAVAESGQLAQPYPLEKGQELGRFELGSTVILLFPPGAVALEPFQPGDAVKLGQTIARLPGGEAGRTGR
jgi:phosphatidylserine decarboxylase